MHVATLPWESKNSIFWRYLADMEENANKLHFKCTDFTESSVYLCFIKILSSWLNTMLIVDKHCSDVCSDELPVPQIDRKSKQVKEQWHKKFYVQSVWGKTAILNAENIQICGWITKLEVIKCNWFALSSTSAEYLQKTEFLISQSSIATWLSWGGYRCIGFVAHFIYFQQCKKFETWLRFDEVIKSLKTQCITTVPLSNGP